ncbi:MAG: plasmid stabilization protein [Patescibacteria group bacterium]
MVELRFTPSFEKEYKKVIKGNVPLRKRITKQLFVLQKNANHPSLRLHKIKNSKYWSISIDKSIRVLILFEKRWIYVYHIGKHEDVY